MPHARRIGAAMVLVAGICIVAACLITSPAAFSQTSQSDGSLLTRVVSLLGLSNADGTRSAFPTLRGVEIRDLFFHVGAAALMLLFGAFFVATRMRPRLTTDDLFEIRRHATSPYFWWALLLFVSIVSSYFSHANDVAMGGVMLRLLTFGWWLPLAVVLTGRQAMRLSGVLVVAVTLTALVGMWYFFERAPWLLRFPFIDGARLRYPIGNELWFGACLLPAIFIAAGAVWASMRSGTTTTRWLSLVAAGAAVLVCCFALYLTRSRSAMAGLMAGLAFGAFVLAPRRARMLVVLISVLIALGGALFIQQKRSSGRMGERAHSIRTRLNHEWPYALTLWFAKPVGGHGEGGYTMQAGQFARAEQLEDPNTIASDGWAWTAEAHNEYLQLLADVGLVGALGFVCALVVTLYWAVRFYDGRRDLPHSGAEGALAAGLAAAVVAVAVEEAGSVGLRHPGLPPLFFASWACLWAVIRGARRVRGAIAPGAVGDAASDAAHESEGSTADDGDKRLHASTLRLGGLIAILAGLGFGFAGIQNWRSARAQFDAQHAVSEGHYAEAISAADWAGRFCLDPMRKLISRRLAVEAQVAEFARRVQTAESAPDADTMQLAQEAAIQSTELNHAAPRFLGLSQLKWQLAAMRSHAHTRRGEPELAHEFRVEYLQWLLQCREDEPFNLEYVAMLWSDFPEPAPLERLRWLRAWLRRNFMASDPVFGALLQSFALQIPDAKSTMDAQLQIARDDLDRAPAHWKDELSPETFRIAAAIAEAQGDPQAAVERGAHAITLYERAGPRLFYAHAAALLELTYLQFRADPLADPAPRFDLLIRATEIMDGPLPAASNEAKRDLPLPREFGQLRLAILLAHGREADARSQLKALAPDADANLDALLSSAYARLANQLLPTGRSDALVAEWIERAEALDPQSLDANIAKLRQALRLGQIEVAVDAANQILSRAPEPRAAFDLLMQIEMEFPDSPVWATLRVNHPDYPRRSGPASAPAVDEAETTSQPAD